MAAIRSSESTDQARATLAMKSCGHVVRGTTDGLESAVSVQAAPADDVRVQRTVLAIRSWAGDAVNVVESLHRVHSPCSE